MAEINISAINLNTLGEFPSVGDFVIRVGQTITVVWISEDLSNVNIVLFKGDTRLLITNKISNDGRNKFTIFVDNSFFSADFRLCKIRIEMKENPQIFSESPPFKILRQEG